MNNLITKSRVDELQHEELLHLQHPVVNGLSTFDHIFEGNAR